MEFNALLKPCYTMYSPSTNQNLQLILTLFKIKIDHLKFSIVCKVKNKQTSKQFQLCREFLTSGFPSHQECAVHSSKKFTMALSLSLYIAKLTFTTEILFNQSWTGRVVVVLSICENSETCFKLITVNDWVVRIALGKFGMSLYNN